MIIYIVLASDPSWVHPVYISSELYKGIFGLTLSVDNEAQEKFRNGKFDIETKIRIYTKAKSRSRSP